MNKLIRNALKSTVLLYFILFLAIVNIIGFLSTGKFDAVVIFAIIGFITQSFSKNMIIILTIPLILTALYATLFSNIKEGLEDKHDNKHDNKDNKDNNKHDNKNISKPVCNELLNENDCNKDDSCKWNNETSKCHSNNTTHNKKKSGEALTQLHPQWIKNDEKTEEEFYKSVDDNVPDLGIQDMADKTSQLIEKQKKLRSSMDKILPLVDQTNKFMDSINLDKITGLLGGLNSNN